MESAAPAPKKRGRPRTRLIFQKPCEKQRAFDRYVYEYLERPLRELRSLAARDDLSALELMAIRTLIRAAETADHSAVLVTLGSASKNTKKRLLNAKPTSLVDRKQLPGMVRKRGRPPKHMRPTPLPSPWDVVHGPPPQVSIAPQSTASAPHIPLVALRAAVPGADPIGFQPPPPAPDGSVVLSAREIRAAAGEEDPLEDEFAEDDGEEDFSDGDE